MYKFRSMFNNADQIKNNLQSDDMTGGVIFKMKKDPRITRVGRIIRKLSIDELPQLWNVLNGDLSLVGPRPPVPKEVIEYSLWDRKRLEVKPGLTCTWQVSGRSDIDFKNQVKLDIDYIKQRSLKFDFILLLKTIPAILSGKGAY
jgi:lipopolysaccharide/colanic/teichoic acid biosynthesis glycosyltransferase